MRFAIRTLIILVAAGLVVAGLGGLRQAGVFDGMAAGPARGEFRPNAAPPSASSTEARPQRPERGAGEDRQGSSWRGIVTVGKNLAIIGVFAGVAALVIRWRDGRDTRARIRRARS